MANWYYRFRVLLLGDSKVGKTSLVRRYTDSTFDEQQAGTFGVDFYAKMVKVAPGVQRVKLQMWDTSGLQRLEMCSLPKSENYTSITRTLFRSIAGVILVFDLNKPDTFANLEGWYTEAQNFLRKQTVFMLVGQKSDQEAPERVPTEEAATWAATRGMAYVETSAKTLLHVDHVFKTLATSIYHTVTCDTPTLGSGLLAPGKGWEDTKVVYRVRSCPPRRKKPVRMCLIQ